MSHIIHVGQDIDLMTCLYKECVDGDCQGGNPCQLEYLQPDQHSEGDHAYAAIQHNLS